MKKIEIELINLDKLDITQPDDEWIFTGDANTEAFMKSYHCGIRERIRDKLIHMAQKFGGHYLAACRISIEMPYVMEDYVIVKEYSNRKKEEVLHLKLKNACGIHQEKVNSENTQNLRIVFYMHYIKSDSFVPLGTFSRFIYHVEELVTSPKDCWDLWIRKVTEKTIATHERNCREAGVEPYPDQSQKITSYPVAE